MYDLTVQILHSIELTALQILISETVIKSDKNLLDRNDEKYNNLLLH